MNINLGYTNLKVTRWALVYPTSALVMYYGVAFILMQILGAEGIIDFF